VLALVHTPLDVAGGVLVAFVGALWYLQADRPYITTNTRTKDKNLVQ
jgi:membrane-associated phospholipid phosphatase